MSSTTKKSLLKDVQCTVLRSYSVIVKMETSTLATLNFGGDEVVLNINLFHRNYAGFVFATNLKH